MEINRYPRQDRKDKDGKAPIRFMVHYHNKRLPVPTGEKVLYPEGWDEGKQKIKAKQPFASIINQKLDNMERTLEFVYQHAQGNRIDLTNESFKLAFDQVYAQVLATGASETQDVFTNSLLQLAFDQLTAAPQEPVPEPTPALLPSFFELMEQWIAEEKGRIVEASGRVMSANTIKGLNSTMARFKAFELHRNKPITVEGMDKYYYAEFRDYMLKDLGQGINNFGKHVRRLKQFLTWCEDHNEELPVNPKYVRFSAPSRYKGVEFLYPQELRAIQKLDFKSPELRERLQFSYSNKLSEELQQAAFNEYIYQVELARDIFLMCCYTALRISDCQDLRLPDIKGELVIRDNQKTENYSYSPFFDDEFFKPVALVKKYEGTGEGDKLFPTCPKVNFHLKTVQKLAGITRLILTTKIGRKTFATIKVYLGVPRSIVMVASGHRTESSFNRYLGVDEKELINVFKQFAPKAA